MLNSVCVLKKSVYLNLKLNKYFITFCCLKVKYFLKLMVTALTYYLYLY